MTKLTGEFSVGSGDYGGDSTGDEAAGGGDRVIRDKEQSLEATDFVKEVAAPFTEVAAGFDDKGDKTALELDGIKDFAPVTRLGGFAEDCGLARLGAASCASRYLATVVNDGHINEVNIGAELDQDVRTLAPAAVDAFDIDFVFADYATVAY